MFPQLKAWTVILSLVVRNYSASQVGRMFVTFREMCHFLLNEKYSSYSHFIFCIVQTIHTVGLCRFICCAAVTSHRDNLMGFSSTAGRETLLAVMDSVRILTLVTQHTISY